MNQRKKSPIKPFFLSKMAIGIVVFGITAIQYSCSYFHPDEVVPGYIQIDTFSFQSQAPDSTGYPTQRISEVWLFANNQVLGVYSIPTGKIPVIAKGRTNISIQAGVFTDGIRKNRVYYPFYRPFETLVELEQGKVTTLTPHFSYTAQKKIPFTFYQDFELSDSGCIKGDDGNVFIQMVLHGNTAKPALFGNRYAKLTTASATDVIEFSNNVTVPLPTNGNPVYLEFDYKSTCPILVGVNGFFGNNYFGSSSDLVLNPREEWTKIYVSLSEETSKFNTEAILKRTPARFRFFLKTVPEPGPGNSLSLDNIRLIN